MNTPNEHIKDDYDEDRLAEEEDLKFWERFHEHINSFEEEPADEESAKEVPFDYDFFVTCVTIRIGYTRCDYSKRYPPTYLIPRVGHGGECSIDCKKRPWSLPWARPANGARSFAFEYRLRICRDSPQHYHLQEMNSSVKSRMPLQRRSGSCEKLQTLHRLPR